ncbi:MAG: J domain-containing protein [Alphaproteobacteria bacterium]|nr:MAG: J domain-containing protein [Alphaproteobacteria bacterium]
MSSLRTPYQVLNVTPDAEGVVIEAAYKALIKKYHPDHWVGDPQAQRRAASINQAYDALRDPEAKAELDRELRARRTQAHKAPFQQVHRKVRSRGWWLGWIAAAVLAGLQFAPRLPVRPDAADGNVSVAAADPVKSPHPKPVETPGTGSQPRLQPIAEVEAAWMPPVTMPSPASIAPREQAPPPPAAAATAEEQPRVAQAPERRTARARPKAQQRRAGTSKRKSDDFLEREGYIY